MAKNGLADYLTTEEAAPLLRLTVATTQKYCQRGVIGCERKGHTILIPRSEVDAYNKNRRPKGWPRRGSVRPRKQRQPA